MFLLVTTYCHSDKLARMLTRSQVARRLRRSLATVRRMEGQELNPVCNERGVHLFDEGEVEQAARHLEEHGRRTAADDDGEFERFMLQRRLATAELQLSTLRTRHDALTKENAELKQAIRSMGRLTAGAVEAVGEELDPSFERALRRLSRKAGAFF